MRYFYVRHDNKLAVVRSFVFQQGQTPLVRTPTLGDNIFHRSDPALDTFTMDATGLGQQVGEFKVVAADFTVYECIGTNVNGGNGGMVVSGFVAARWPIKDADHGEATRMMREADPGLKGRDD